LRNWGIIKLKAYRWVEQGLRLEAGSKGKLKAQGSKLKGRKG
jgi:hypothetical protein